MICAMKTSILPLLLVPALLAGCDRADVDSPDDGPSAAYGTVYHDEIVLGDRLEDPYSVENVKSAIASLYPTKAGRVDVEETHVYARFLPAGEEDYQRLLDLGLDLSDHPFDYEIVKEGDWYHDPSVEKEHITWQYAVVSRGFAFPEDIRYEILDRCYIPDSDATRAADIDWEAVEREAFRLTGNEAMLEPETKAESRHPEGRITIVDDRVDGGKPFGVAGVRVMTNVFVKFSTTYTDRDGYYKIPKKYSARPRYRLVFANAKKFAIGVNLILLPGSVSTLGKGDASGKDVTVTSKSDRKLFCRCVVNNAVYDYITRCAETDMNLPTPPSGLRIWIFQDLDASSAVMLHHGTIVDGNSLSDYLKAAAWLIKVFGPDLTIGVKDHDDYASIWSSTVHELSHTSHYARVGNSWWNKYITYIAMSYLASGGETYGTGSESNAGYCEVGESWAYYMESKLFSERYGGSMPPFGTSFWFYPQIFRYLDERGFTRAELFAALTSDVTDRVSLQKKLIELYPTRSGTIQTVFDRYAR